MSSATDHAAPPPPPAHAPSVFISYASEDRAAARALRDTLSAAGIDVWYDEQELTGGDAWDQKIRRQIRDCEYFMPVISATTESRKEGYFRREWRLAVERSLDMADDVLFLIPVAIDDTREAGARVPDKFLTVQWLRAPGGNATPALHHLVRRILSGDHHALTRPPMAYRPTVAPFAVPPAPEPPPLTEPPVMHPQAGASAAAATASLPPPPPMPPFPHVPEKGGLLHGIKFFAEVLWWALTASWMLFNRLPRWARIIVTIWLVLTLFNTRGCVRNVSFGDSDKPPKTRVSVTDPAGEKRNVDTAEAEQAVKNAIEKFAQSAREARKNGNNVDLARIGSEIARSFGQGGPGAPDGAALGKRLVLVPFARINAEDPADKFASGVFAALYGRLTLTHARDVGLLRQAQGASGENALFLRGKALGSKFILTGHLTGDADARALAVSLLVTEDSSTKWTETFPLKDAEPSDIADKIADRLDELLPTPPRREFPKQK